ncbi:HesA/MoeB/ThiF family protein [Olivibacter sp. CPCC 100613]|uniref:HesA/MoeB/ThiF family protein n=1 Tax=Olivibacter sp. CPCC 100613 TaxID=3079931 RepID=UPI002FF92D30
MERSLSERYHRQRILREFGVIGQRKLLQTSVLVVGAGGLGCPALLYLTAAGFGRIGIIDNGLIELSNLHRQILYGTQDIGKKKVSCAKDALQKVNSDVEIDTFDVHLTSSNAIDIIAGYDIVIDGTDNFESRYLINDACAILERPLIYGAVSKYEGQVAIFANGINYRDIFPHPPKDGEIMNCSEAGVLNILPGIIGNFQANECIKLVTGIGEPLIGKLLTYNALNNQTYTVEIDRTELSKQLRPKSKQAFQEVDYAYLCAVQQASLEEISAEELRSLYTHNNIDIVDVREAFETPKLKKYSPIEIPLSTLDKEIRWIQKEIVVFVCQSGKRSLLAARRYTEMIQPQKKMVYSLKGGINSLERPI